MRKFKIINLTNGSVSLAAGATLGPGQSRPVDLVTLELRRLESRGIVLIQDQPLEEGEVAEVDLQSDFATDVQPPETTSFDKGALEALIETDADIRAAIATVVPTTPGFGKTELQALIDGDADVKSSIAAIPAIAGKADAVALVALALSSHGRYDISKAPGVVLGALANSAARQANGVALQAAFDYCATNRLVAIAPAGRFEYEATGVQNGRNVGLQIKKNSVGFIGAGMDVAVGTAFIQYAVNHPVLTIGDVSTDDTAAIGGAHFSGFVCGHGVSQAGQTSADGILLGRIWYSVLDQFGTNAFVSGSQFPPYVGLRVGFSTATFFSNTIPQCLITSGQLHYILWTAGGTGNAIGSLYAGSGGIGNRVALTGSPVFFNASGSEIGSIQQLNIEWANSSDGYGGLRVDNGVGLNIDVLHFEGIKLNGFSPALIAAISSRIKIGTVRSLDTWIAAANASGTPVLVKFYDASRVKIDQLNARWGGTTEKVASMAFSLFAEDTSLVGRRPMFEVGHVDLDGHTGAFSLDSLLTVANSGAVNRIRDYRYHPALPRTRGATLTLPTGVGTNTIYGVHEGVQVVLDSALTAARTTLISDVLMAAGIGSLSKRNPDDVITFHRTGNATGAFNWTIKDASNTITLATLTAVNTTASIAWSDFASLPIPVATSRNLTAADNGLVLECTATVTLTVPTGLPAGFGCTIITNGTTTITGATGVTVNAVSAGSVTRAASTNPIVSIVGRVSASNNYLVTGS